jgi:hypothetical protein
MSIYHCNNAAHSWWRLIMNITFYLYTKVWSVLYSAFRKPLCTYKRCWKWCPRASIQVWTRLILFANTFCRSACEMFLVYAVIAVFNSLSIRGRSRYTADFDNQIYVLWPKCTATFRIHCTVLVVIMYIKQKWSTASYNVFCCTTCNCVLYRVYKKMMFKISGVIFHFVPHVWVSVMQNMHCPFMVLLNTAASLYTKPASTGTSHDSCLAYRHHK